MRREPKRVTKEVRDYVADQARWQVWAGLAVVALLITAAVWPRGERSLPYGGTHEEEFPNVWAFHGPDPIDINEAALEDIRKIPAVDEEIAQGIIEKRPFEEVEGLLDVRGIGKQNLMVIRQYIYIDND